MFGRILRFSGSGKRPYRNGEAGLNSTHMLAFTCGGKKQRAEAPNGCTEYHVNLRRLFGFEVTVETDGTCATHQTEIKWADEYFTGCRASR